MSQNIDELPQDKTTTPSQAEIDIVDRLLKATNDNPEAVKSIGSEFKEALIVTGLFILLSLPLIDSLLDNVGFLKDGWFFKLIAKALIMFIVTYIIFKVFV
jgi:hypothetical protein